MLFFLAAIIIGKTPLQGLKCPLRESSPINPYFFISLGLIFPASIISPIAIAKS